MSTPPEIVAGDTWTLTNDLGSGVGAMPAGAPVVVVDLLPPFSPGVSQVNEITVVSTYTWADWYRDPSGNMIEAQNTRRLAYPESDFRALFTPPGGA